MLPTLAGDCSKEMEQILVQKGHPWAWKGRNPDPCVKLLRGEPVQAQRVRRTQEQSISNGGYVPV